MVLHFLDEQRGKKQGKPCWPFLNLDQTALSQKLPYDKYMQRWKQGSQLSRGAGSNLELALVMFIRPASWDMGVSVTRTSRIKNWPFFPKDLFLLWTAGLYTISDNIFPPPRPAAELQVESLTCAIQKFWPSKEYKSGHFRILCEPWIIPKGIFYGTHCDIEQVLLKSSVQQVCSLPPPCSSLDGASNNFQVWQNSKKARLQTVQRPLL